MFLTIFILASFIAFVVWDTSDTGQDGP